MAMNASGIRDTARVLHVSPTTVLKELKKAPALTQVHQTERMHDLVIGLFINRYEFGVSV